jgi:hypothetical protein
MRVRFIAPFDYVTTRSANGTPRATVAYKPTEAAVTVPRAHGEAAVAAGKAVETPDEPAVREEIVNQVRARGRK